MKTRLTAFDVFARVVDALGERRPATVIRLGDGEGAVLGFPEHAGRGDVDRFLRIWLRTADVPIDALLGFVRELRAAVADADIVGLPREKQVATNRLWAAVEIAITTHGLGGSWETTDAALHRLLQHALLYRPLLAGREFVGLVTCREVSRDLAGLFGIGDIRAYLVRGERDQPGNAVLPHFPDGYEAIREDLRVPYRGALFLVGAGAFGKVYCHWIKQRGGIALDIGSMFDSWAGIGRIGRGEGIALRSLDVYRQVPSITAPDAVQRYNDVAERLGIDDTPHAGLAHVDTLPNAW